MIEWRFQRSFVPFLLGAEGLNCRLTGCPLRPQSAFPTFAQLAHRGPCLLKEGAHILSYVYQFQGGLLKELVALMRAGGERGDS